MSTYKGKKLTVEIFGGSHETETGARLFGLGDFCFDMAALEAFMERRSPIGPLSTARKEPDKLNIERTEGCVTITIKNEDVDRSAYDCLYGKPRPSHADLAAFLKDGTLANFGGGRFSGRMTAALCAVGGICKQYLESEGVAIAAYLEEASGVKGLGYKEEPLCVDRIEKFRGKIVPSLTEGEKIAAAIEKAKNGGDSVGGKVGCVVEGFPAGLGDALFDGLESKISALLFAIPAVKAVEFGAGVDFAAMTGSVANDQMAYENGKIRFLSDNSGGINGGVSNGDRVTFSVTFRPTPSIALPQQTVDLVKGENCVIEIKGRHDACVALRAVPVVEAAAAVALADELSAAK